MSRILTVLKAVRFQNLLILAIAQLATAYFLGKSEISIFLSPSLWMLVFATGFIAAAGYVINDYYDIKIDLVNHPESVVVGKDLPRRQALMIHTFFNFTGIIIGALIDWRIGLINLISAFLLWWYSNYLKQLALVGNLVIGALTSLSITLIVALFPQNTLPILIFSFFAGSISLVREILKDVEDQTGDKKFGCRTLPVVIGVRKTKNVLNFLILLFSVSYIFLAYRYFHEVWLYYLVVLLPILVILMLRIARADKKRDFSWLSGFTKFIMLIGICLMALS